MIKIFMMIKLKKPFIGFNIVKYGKTYFTRFEESTEEKSPWRSGKRVGNEFEQQSRC